MVQEPVPLTDLLLQIQVFLGGTMLDSNFLEIRCKSLQSQVVLTCLLTTVAYSAFFVEPTGTRQAASSRQAPKVKFTFRRIQLPFLSKPGKSIGLESEKILSKRRAKETFGLTGS